MIKWRGMADLLLFLALILDDFGGYLHFFLCFLPFHKLEALMQV